MSIHKIEINSRGNLNGVDYAAKGSGTADPSLGLIEFGVSFYPTPPGADSFGSLLSILIIPTSGFGREIGNTVNLLTLTNGTFQFRQDVAADGIAATSTGKMDRVGTESFHWDSHAGGVVELEGVTGVDPFDAVMIPQGDGKITEVLSIPLICSAGRRPVTIVRQFTFAPHVGLSEMQLRRMTLEPTIRKDSVSVKIKADIIPFTPQSDVDGLAR
jgi:hypothetical protein